MANKDGHRRFGSVRKLPSGRYQARYLGPDGLMRKAPETFARKGDAEQYLTIVEAQMIRRDWIDPDRAKIRLKDYAERWIAQRANLRPRTVQLYTWLLGKHVTPYLGKVTLSRLDTPMVREWRTTLLTNGVSPTMAAKAYRLLRAVLMTAVKEDELIRVNPCRVPGADQEKPGERPVLTVPQVLDLSERVPERYRALVLLTTFACLRWGEVAALQRRDIDLTAGTVRVRHAFTEQRGVGLVLGLPKSRAGLRTVTVPRVVLASVRAHLAEYVDDNPDAYVFTVPTGRPIWRGNFNKLVKWPEVVKAIGAPGLHFHDLRHTGNTLASRAPGASLRDLMARMGHDSPRAALIYQHASSQADQAIADAVNAEVKKAARKAAKRPKKRRGDPDDGAAGVLAKVG
ncbi:tyrosine-type recombinase/integrase [Micromonospora sp. NPDC004704]